MSNRDRIGRALELLQAGLEPYVGREMQSVFKRGWLEAAQQAIARSGSSATFDPKKGSGDVQALLTLMREQWREVFGKKLGQFERNLVHELLTTRNDWAHQKPFSADDALRALDSINRMLSAISAPEAAELERLKQEQIRVQYEAQPRREARRATTLPLGGQPSGELRPWREVVTPHPDVASGRYRQAEFAADLGQVHRGEGLPEYAEPREFFHRTFLTHSLRQLLTDALRRLGGAAGGDPVVDLQTNFGGGKTHSMLGLYHLFSGAPPEELAGIGPLLVEAGVESPITAHRAVLVGTALSPSTPKRKPDGTVTRTFWGEMAWQLGGADGYGLVAEADERGVSPGSDILRDLFELFAPCLVLIDEWVAFIRQLDGVEGLPAGSFEANLTFAQALAEAARQAPQTLVVASIPASDVEVGGEAGQRALARISHIFHRLDAPWRPATTEEGFEIVRRRLFEPIREPDKIARRDAVAKAFSQLYQAQPGEFPAHCREAAYERRIIQAYPIHPELFDRLFGDWSALDRFQRTRGVLRLMAAVIHSLWERQDANLLILPGMVPIDEAEIHNEFRQYLEEPWDPVIETDVDGPQSVALALDAENPNLGRYSSARRVARTIFLGSAPKGPDSPNRGLEDRQIKLGSVQPGEGPAIFGDALRRLTDRATHLYVDNQRYWFARQPSVTRLAQDRAEQLSRDAVLGEIRARVRAQRGQRGDFASVHPCPASPADVSDEQSARLVILDPDQPHAPRGADSPARGAASRILDSKGTGPRDHKNMLAFLAPDRARLAELETAVRQYLAWKSIDDQREELNLDAFQAGQAASKRKQADETVDARLPETYSLLLVPEQRAGESEVTWQEIRLQGSEALATRASRKLRADSVLIIEYGSALLRMELDRVPLWQGDHVGVRQLWDYLTKYLYLPRLRDEQVLLKCIAQGTGSLAPETDGFAYAEAWDESNGRYAGLRLGRVGSVVMDGRSLLVKPDVARRQLDAEAAAPKPTPGGGDVTDGQGEESGGDYPGGAARTPSGAIAEAPVVLRRFHGTVQLDATRLARDAGTVAEEVVQHLSGIVGSKVSITVEIEAEIPDGASEQVVRTVNENARTLKFTNFGFEES